MAKKGTTAIDPAALAMQQLVNMDSGSYELEESSEDTPVEDAPEAAPRKAPSGRRIKGAAKEKASTGRRRYVQMYMTPEVYADLKLAKMAYFLARKETISASALVELLLEKGFRQADPEVAKTWSRLRKEGIPFGE